MRPIELTTGPACVAIRVRERPRQSTFKGINVFRKVAIWTAAILLGISFALIGFSKLTGPSSIQWATRLSHWGYPAVSRYAIGGIEMLAGISLFIPPVRRAATIALIVVMAGALLTHLIHGEWIRILPPLIFGAWAYGLYAFQPRPADKA